jgi:hypothetical protein
MILARLINGGDGVGVGLLEHLDEIAGERRQRWKGMIAPASADVMQHDFRICRHPLPDRAPSVWSAPRFTRDI